MTEKELTADKELSKWLKSRTLQELETEDNEYTEEEMQSFAEHYHEIKSKEERINYIRLEAYKDKLEEWNNRDKAKIKELKSIIAYYENGTPLNKETLKNK